MSKLTLNVTRAEYENRLVEVLETAMGSPLTKKRREILNNAMVTMLHGKRGDGKNEHNLDMFWNEAPEPVERTPDTTWLVTENYLHEDGYDTEEIWSFSAESELAAQRELYKRVCEYVADSTPYIISMELLAEALDEAGSTYMARYLAANGEGFQASECDGEDVADFIRESCNEDIKTHGVIFNYITNLMCIKGSHSIQEFTITNK